ncbi:MAG TPA: alpha/beta hydrolase [Ktedonobacteraceae bacterium]|jgi:pimeloyl-ACP methyl ester carboxylesterase|nr:alpha/beta hydrolase [Ktedonobacteraceae bacterium]
MTLPDSPGTTSSQKTERTVEVQGIVTHLFEAGPAAAPPLLYLHGTHLGNLWLDFHQALAQHFHVFAPDIPGFGLTERPDWMRDMDDYILYYRDLLGTLGLQRTALVGHSLGGWIAAEVAIWYPERVSELVLSNAAGIRVKGAMIGNLFAMNLQELVAACFDDPMAALPLMPAEVNADYLVQMYKERTTLASLAWNPHFDPKLARRLQWLRCPTLIIWGENDRLIPPVYGDTLHSLIPGSRLVRLAGTGHMPMFEQHEAWAQHITRFLQERQEETNA